MVAIIVFLLLSLTAAALVVAGVYCIAGLGFALLVAGACCAFAAWFLRKGMTVE